MEDRTDESLAKGRHSMTTIDRAMERARELGAEHGESAAQWFFDGNTTEDTYRKVLQGIDDGDPEIMDTLPHADLSGEWVDGMTPAKLYAEVGVDEQMLDAIDDLGDSLCQDYEFAYNDAARYEVESKARGMLA